MKGKTTKKVRSEGDEGDLLPEYRFDYSKAKPNRFADLANASPVTVAIDPDVAEVFHTPEAVNSVLRAIIRALPDRQDEEAPTAA